ncbi:MAG: hypothetical protein E7235_01480 [Lachnospiraceae bacterium]|nr:hypothetical protein [Lachnospiraceae bacterium]
MLLPFELVYYYLSKNWTVKVFPEMKDYTSDELIKCNLLDNLPIRLLPENNEYRDLSLPMLFSSDILPIQGKTVIADVSMLSYKPSPNDNGCIICFGGEPPEYFKNGKYDLMIIEGDAHPSDVLNCVMQCFTDYLQWENTVRSLLDGSGSLQDILNVSCTYFGNRLDVTDTSFSLLAASQNGKPADSKSRPDKYKYGNKSLTRISKYRNDLINMHQIRIPFFWFDDMAPAGPNSFPTICVNLFDSNIFLASITSVPTNRPFQRHDLKMIARLAPYVQECILRQQEDMGNSYITLLRDTLNNIVIGKTPDSESLNYLTGAVGFKSYDIYTCAVIDLPPETNVEYKKYVKKQILSLLPSFIVFSHLGKLIIVTNQSLSDKSDVFDILYSLIKDMQLFVGVSNPFNDLAKLKDYYLEASVALELSLQCPERPHIAFFSEHQDKYILSHCSGDLPPHLFFPDGLNRLIEYDKTAQVSYIDTLRKFLDCDRNSSEAARELYISRNTLLARLDRIDSILKLNMDDPEVRFHLSLCLRMMKNMY